MANFVGVFEMVDSISMVAGEDLTGNEGRLLTVDNAGKVVRSSAAADFSIGVLAMNANVTHGGTEDSTDDIVQVALLNKGGVMLGEAGGVIALGALVVSDAQGRIVSAGANIAAASANDYVVGVCVEAAAAAGERVSFLAAPFHKSA